MSADPCAACGAGAGGFQACSCRIVYTDGTNIPGTGAFATPYIIDLCALMGQLRTVLGAPSRIGNLTDQFLVLDAAGVCVNVTLPPTPPLDCEEVQDCVGSMLNSAGFAYDDPGDQWIPVGNPGDILTITAPGVSAFVTPAPFVLNCEDVQDCVGGMLNGVGFIYDDANNQFDATGAPGTVLTSIGGGTAAWVAPGVYVLVCEDVQDCVGAMLNTVGFQYNDAANRWDAQAAAAGTVLTNNGAGAATWQPIPSATNFTIQSVFTGDCGTSANGGVATVLTGENIQFRAFRGLGINVADGGAQNFVDLFLPGVNTSLANIGFPGPDSAGAGIYCGAGVLRTLPPWGAEGVRFATSAANGFFPGGGTINGVVTPLIAVNNPSAFRFARGIAICDCSWTSGNPLNTQDLSFGIQAYSSPTIGGGAVYPVWQGSPFNCRSNLGRFEAKGEVHDGWQSNPGLAAFFQFASWLSAVGFTNLDPGQSEIAFSVLEASQ